MSRIAKFAVLFSLLATFSVLSSWDAGMSAPAPNLDALAVEGDIAPGTGGLRYFFGCARPGGSTEVFDEPMVNSRGDVTYFACLTGNTWGLFFKPFGGPHQLIAMGGQSVPGVGTLPLGFDSTDGPQINNNGTVIFVINGITGGSTTAAVFMKKTVGSLFAVWKQGDPTPGAPAGVVSTFLTFDDMALNNLDDVAVIATYIEPRPAAAVTVFAGVFFKTSGGVGSAILRNGDLVPGAGGLSTFTGISGNDVDGPWLNDAQVVAFADLSSVGAGNTEGIFARRPGMPIEQFVMFGDPLPASVGGGTVQSLAMGRPALGNSNRIGFQVDRTLPDPGTHIFAASKVLGAASIDVCVADKAPAPRTAGIIDGIGPVAMDEDGTLIFHADIAGDPANVSGLFTCKGGVVESVALTSDPRPGGGAWSFSLEEESIGVPFSTFIDEGINAGGIKVQPACLILAGGGTAGTHGCGPTLAKQFGAASIPIGGVTSLTITFSNKLYGPLTGIAFSDTLPGGLVIATPNGLTNTCGGAVTAVAGSTILSLTGGTVAGSSTCSVTVNVTAPAGTTLGAKNNSTNPATTAEGFTATAATATLNVGAAAPASPTPTATATPTPTMTPFRPPVIPQIFQNPAAVGIVQAGNRATPTPYRAMPVVQPQAVRAAADPIVITPPRTGDGGLLLLPDSEGSPPR